MFAALQVRVRASQGSLDIRGLHLFAHINLNQLRHRLLSKTILVCVVFQRMTLLHPQISTQDILSTFSISRISVV